VTDDTWSGTVGIDIDIATSMVLRMKTVTSIEAFMRCSIAISTGEVMSWLESTTRWHSTSAFIRHCGSTADTHWMLTAIILHRSRQQLQLQHTNINTHIIRSDMGMLTYLSASSIHLTLSTYDAFSSLHLPFT